MSERHYRLYLNDILESGHAIQLYVEGITYDNMLIHEYFGVDLQIIWNTIFSGI